jgi:VCBS repeat-containing protein
VLLQVDSSAVLGLPSLGHFSVNDGVFTFDPGHDFDYLGQGQSATESVTYEVAGNSGVSTGTISVTVQGVGDAPIAGNASYDTNQDVAVTNSVPFTLVDQNDSGSVGLLEDNVPRNAYLASVGSMSASFSSSLASSILLFADSSNVQGATTLGHFSVNGGTFTFDPGSDFDYLAPGQSATETATYEVTGNSGVSTGTISVTVHGLGDAPIAFDASFDTNQDVAVTDSVPFTLVDQGDSAIVGFTQDFVPRNATTGLSNPPAVTVVSSASSIASSVLLQVDSSAVLGLPSLGHFSVNDGVFTFDPGHDFDYLAQGQSATETVTYEVAGNSGVSTGTISVTVDGTNDTPVIDTVDSTASASITEQAGVTGSSVPDTASGAIVFNDADLSDTHTASAQLTGLELGNIPALPKNQQRQLVADERQLQQQLQDQNSLQLVMSDSTWGGTGIVNWTFAMPDSAFDFLAPGWTLTLGYDVTITDNNGASAVEPLTITVTGSGDAPLADDVSAETSQDVAITGTVPFSLVDIGDSVNIQLLQDVMPRNAYSGQPGLIGSASAGFSSSFASSITLFAESSAFLGSSVLGHFSTSAGTFSFDPGQDYDYLAQGESATETVTYQVIGNSGATTATISVTVDGTNDTPVIDTAGSTAAATITEQASVPGSSTADIATGSIYFSDADIDDAHTASASAPSFAWSGGALSDSQQAALLQATSLSFGQFPDDTGSADWTFSAADSAFRFMAAGQTLTVTYDVSIADNWGATAMQPVVITINGIDAPPTITTPVISGTVQEDQTLTASATAGEGGDTVSYAWYSSADNYTHPVGTGASYVVKDSDEGFTVEVVATATGTNGLHTSSTSMATAPVLPKAEPPVLTGASGGGFSEGAAVTLGVHDSSTDSDDTLGNVTITGLPSDLSHFNGGTYTGTPATTVVNFDSVNTSGGDVSGAAAINYLAGSGITFSSQSGTPDILAYAPGNPFPNPASSPNWFGVGGPANGFTYTFSFASSLSSFSFTVPGLGNSSTMAAWSATAYSATGTQLAQVGNPNVSFPNSATQTYTLSGPGIASVQFFDNVEGFAGNHLALDNITLNYAHPGGTWTGTAAQFNALSFNAGETTGTFNLSISAATTGAEAGTTTGSYALSVNPVAEGPLLGGANITPGNVAPSAVAGVAFALGATDTAADADDTLGNVTITGLPTNLAAVNGGTYTASSGTWVGTAAQFNALSITPGASTGTYNLSIAATTTGAEAATTIASYALTVIPTISGFSGGTLNANWSGPTISNGTLTLTNNGGSEASTWFYNSKVSIGTFTAAFDYQVSGNEQADGMAMVLQNSGAGPAALGGNGSGLGYQGIAPSAAVEFNIYNGHVQGTALATNGSVGSYTSSNPVQFWNGDKTHVDLSYNGSTLTETLTDTVTHSTFTANYAANLASVLGGSSAYVGFSGGTGGATSIQQISNFNFVDGEADPNNAGVPGISIADGASAAIGTDGANAVTFAGSSGMLVLGQSASFTGSVAGFGGADQIDLEDIAFTTASTLGYSGDAAGGVLSVGDGSHVAQLALLGSYMASSFVTGGDGHGGTLLSVAAGASQDQQHLAQPHA